MFVCRDVVAGDVLVKEPALVQVTVPHTPKTLAKFLGQIRQEVKRLEEEKQEEFFALHNARKELCTKNRGIKAKEDCLSIFYWFHDF